MLNSNLARTKKGTGVLWCLHKKGDSAFFAMGGGDEHQGSAFHHSGGQHVNGRSGTFHSECGEQCHGSALYEVRRNVNGRGGGAMTSDVEVEATRFLWALLCCFIFSRSDRFDPIIKLPISGSFHRFNQQQVAILGHPRSLLEEPRWNNFEWGWRIVSVSFHKCFQI